MIIIYFLLAALALGVLVFIHEMGHFLAAKAMGMVVESFSIGFGPAIFNKKIGEVQYRIGLIPFGGYVKIKGMERSREDKLSSESNETDIYDIPGGFFNKRPLQRIFVLIAGPLANVLLAYILFTGVHALGGRNKNFSEFTQVVGWVNPFLKEKGLYPGDHILMCNGKVYSGEKDGVSAALLEGVLNLDYERPNYLNRGVHNHNLSTNYNVSEKGIPFTGASYLIYDGSTSLEKKSPMNHSGILPGDRLVWMDGELIFSSYQLSQLLNENYSFIRVQRGDHIFTTRQPRVLASALYMSTYIRNEFIDSQYEAGIKGKWGQLNVLPYLINSHGFVETCLQSLDQNFPIIFYDQSLEPGDLVLAVDGVPVSSNAEILQLTQERRVNIIVERIENNHITPDISIKDADVLFTKSLEDQSLTNLILSVGSSSLLDGSSKYKILNAVKPRNWKDIYSKNLLEKQILLAKKIKNREKRQALLDNIERETKRLSLGISFHDLTIKYNPQASQVLMDVVSDSIRTLKALFTGRLGPKWLSGPVGIVQILQTGWSVGASEALFWCGLISMNLAVLNLLPIPALDGGYILLCFWELVTRKRLNMRVLERVLIPFIIILILLFIFLTIQDLFRLLG